VLEALTEKLISKSLEIDLLLTPKVFFCAEEIKKKILEKRAYIFYLFVFDRPLSALLNEKIRLSAMRRTVLFVLWLCFILSSPNLAGSAAPGLTHVQKAHINSSAAH